MIQVDPCQTEDSSEHRILRGGSWDYDPDLCLVAFRNYRLPDNRLNDYGFRICFRLD